MQINFSLNRTVSKTKTNICSYCRVEIYWGELSLDGYSDFDFESTKKLLNELNEMKYRGIPIIGNINMALIPNSILDEGGWDNPSTVDLFLYFMSVCYEMFSKTIDHWSFGFYAGNQQQRENLNVILALHEAVNSGRLFMPLSIFGKHLYLIKPIPLGLVLDDASDQLSIKRNFSVLFKKALSTWNNNVSSDYVLHSIAEDEFDFLSVSTFYKQDALIMTEALWIDDFRSINRVFYPKSSMKYMFGEINKKIELPLLFLQK